MNEPSDSIWGKPVWVTTAIGPEKDGKSSELAELAMEDAAQVWAHVEKRCEAKLAERFRQRVNEWPVPHKEE